MSKLTGNCPYCNGIVSCTEKNIRGRKTKLYTCSNHKVVTEDGETWELSDGATCNFRIFGNTLARYGKKFIGSREVQKLLNGDEVIGYFYSFQKKIEYKKYLTLNNEYGISVLWDIEI